MAKAFTHRLADCVSANTLRKIINMWPPYLGAGIKVTTIAADYRSITVSMKLTWFNTNLVGTHFGGSIFSMTDPFFMLMLIKNLGDEYIVWDKAARIDFKKPGRGKLEANFHLSESEIKAIQEQTDQQGKYIFDLSVDVMDQEQQVIASITKTLYVRRKHKNP